MAISRSRLLTRPSASDDGRGGPLPQSLAIPGTGNAETLNGTPGDDQIYGYGGNDVLNGLDGNDQLYGGTGADTTNGGIGNDSHFVDNAADIVREAAGEGADRVLASVSYTLTAGAEVETLSTDWNDGTAAINLTGNELANRIFGNAGDNVLNGGKGADMLVGLGGTNIYYVDNAADLVVETASDSDIDRVFTSVSYTLPLYARIELFTTSNHVGTEPLNLTGNPLSQTIYGNDGANILIGGGGNDILYGRAGNDIFTASPGFDTYHGEDGDDVYYVNNPQDVVIDTGSGNDRVFASVSYTLRTSVEMFSTDVHTGKAAINLTGANGNETLIVGNDGPNVLDGKGGNDGLYGAGGKDVFAFTTRPGAANADKIYAFWPGDDKIGLDDAVFQGIGTPGHFNANAFVVGTAAGDADDRIIYNQTAQQLLYDRDGSGPMTAELFASFDYQPRLVAGDFIVI